MDRTCMYVCEAVWILSAGSHVMQTEPYTPLNAADGAMNQL
jgi:hypothetical protein